MILLFVERIEIVVCFRLKFFLLGEKGETVKLVLSEKGEDS